MRMKDEDAKQAAQRMRKQARELLEQNPDKGRRMALFLVGSQLALRDVPLEIADDVSGDDRRALANGYISAETSELARKPPWYTDLPLIGRIISASRHLRGSRKSEES